MNRNHLPRPSSPEEELQPPPSPRHYCYGDDDGGGGDVGERVDELSYASVPDSPKPEPIPRYDGHARRDEDCF